MKYTNNDLAKAMGLKVGKKYKHQDGNELTFVFENEFGDDDKKDYWLKHKNGCLYPLSYFVGDELTEVIETPKLTEQEITILKGRQAEGFMTIKRQGSEIYLLTLIVGRGIDMFSDAGLFQTLDELKPYSIAELLKGNE